MYMEIVAFIVFFLVLSVLIFAVYLFAAIVSGHLRSMIRRWYIAPGLALVVCLSGNLIGRNISCVKIVDIHSTTLPESFEGYRIVHISDMHLRSFISRHGALRRIVNKISALEADMICFTGDMVSLSADEVVPFVATLSSLKAPDGVFSVQGNHDCLIYERMSTKQRQAQLRRLVEMQRSLGWIPLADSASFAVRGSDSIAVVGVDNISADSRFPTNGSLRDALRGVPQGMFKVLLSHDPTHWQRDIEGTRGIDLTLSGHTHKMQISLFGWTPSSLIYDCSGGLYGEQDCFLYVNAGLGETILPVRIGAHAEITLVRLHSN